MPRQLLDLAADLARRGEPVALATLATASASGSAAAACGGAVRTAASLEQVVRRPGA